MHINPNDRLVIEAEIFISTVDEDSLQLICDFAWLAMQKSTSPSDVASYLKNKCDQVFGPAWQCIVGKTFGSFVSVDSASLLNFRIGRTMFLVYKTYSREECEAIKETLKVSSI
ncbi:dynein light chain type 1 domain-containing protein [Ditylenchus destructor]|nr:dynein light chain type 1 domain-containing protein [Ditylenchus destructor]